MKCLVSGRTNNKNKKTDFKGLICNFSKNKIKMDSLDLWQHLDSHSNIFTPKETLSFDPFAGYLQEETGNKTTKYQNFK